MQEAAAVGKAQRQVLVFSLSQNEFGIDIACVREVLRIQKAHPIPNAPEFVEGVVNLRGRIILVIDLRKKINIGTAEGNPPTRIVVCSIKRFIAGFIVDSVGEVIGLSAGDIEPVPAALSQQGGGSYISGIARLGERVITLLDPGKILSGEEIGKLSEVKE